MDISAFKYDQHNDHYEISYWPRVKRWRDEFVGKRSPVRNSANWSEEIRYLQKGKLSEKIKNLPTNTGGVYMFYLKGLNLPFAETYILYIGRAKFTPDENIRKRAKEYITDNRVKIEWMFNQWGKDLYYRYYPETNNDEIVRIEAALIRAIVPPCNSEIPNKVIIKQSTSAF